MRKQIREQLKEPGRNFRGAPFWALNGRLSGEELIRQLRILKEMGFGGVFLHSRTGLATEYLGEEWFSAINACVDEAARLGMDAYLYDEDRWPSGSAGGLVTADPRFRQKYLVAEFMEPADFEIGDYGTDYVASFAIRVEGDRNLTEFEQILHASEVPEGWRVAVFRIELQANSDFYNGYTYLDTLNRTATDRFLETTLEQYRKKCGERIGDGIRGVFTDEPQRGSLLCGFSLSNPGRERMIPWTDSLLSEFGKRWGFDLRDRLPELFFKPQGREFSGTMWRYVEVLTEMFLENFLKPYQKRCGAHGLRLTGHVFHEDSLIAQTAAVGSVMRCYEYMDEPGVDVLWEHNDVYWTVRQAASVVRQLGKKRLLSEMYGVTGWPLTFQGHKQVGDWQTLLGVNFRCHHLAWYTMQGEAKRDYPASISYQSAWYPEYFYVEDYFARLNLLAGESEPLIDIAVLSPVESAWGLSHLGTYRNVFEVCDREYDELNRNYFRFHDILTSLHAEFDYLDEAMLAGHGRVSGNVLGVGKMRYRTVFVAGMLHIRSSTLSLLRDLRAGGGTVVCFGELPCFVDGEPETVSELPPAVPLEESAIRRTLDALDPPLFRLSGENASRILSSFRRVKGGGDFLAMLVNTDRVHSLSGIELTLAGTWKVTEIDVREGEFRERASALWEQRTCVRCSFAEGGERILYFSKGKPSENFSERFSEFRSTEGGGRLERVNVDLTEESYDYRLSEPNVLVLDFASCAGEGFSLGRKEILKLDRELRVRLGLPPRSGEMIQPWFREKFGKTDSAKAVSIELRFEFDVEDLDVPVRLALESPEDFDLSVNGVSAAWTDTGEIYVDTAFRVMEFENALLRPGRNILELRCAFGVATDLEAVYLLGDFGVRLEGNRPILTRRAERLRAGSIVGQGLPFYGGRIKYRIPAEPGLYDFRFEGLANAAVCRVQGKIVAFAPYTAERVRVEDGIEIETVFTRRNTFGPLHRVCAVEDGCAPDSFLTEGEAFTEHYVLNPQGLAEFQAILRSEKR